MGLDAGYHNAPVCHQLAAAGIQPVVGYRRHTTRGTISENTVSPMIQSKTFTWSARARADMAHDQPGRLSGVLERAQNMQGLPKRAKCFSAKSSRRQGDGAMYGRMHWNRRTRLEDKPLGKRIYAWRKETIERSFAEAKELHGLRYARMLGRRNMYEQSFLTAAVQNMKRIARAFRSLFSVLPYAFRAASKRKQPLCRRSEARGSAPRLLPAIAIRAGCAHAAQTAIQNMTNAFMQNSGKIKLLKEN